MTQDTAIGGQQHRFPETRHSAIRGLQEEEDATLRRQSYEIVVAAYWKPVYKYLRLRWNRSNEQAKDLTQSFFASAIEKETLVRYDPGKATFRTYLRTCLDGFVLNVWKYESRLKRSGDLIAGAVSADPDEALHREWVRSVFEIAIADLRIRCDLPFRVFEAYDLTDAETRPSYAELAVRFGMTPPPSPTTWRRCGAICARP